jgi:hypothetical protein
VTVPPIKKGDVIMWVAVISLVGIPVAVYLITALVQHGI